MHYTQLEQYLPEYFDMLLLTPADAEWERDGRVVALPFPVKPNELAGTVEMILAKRQRRLKKKKGQDKKRTEQEQYDINHAKWLLMERNHMTEEEAYRYIQKSSMDSGTDMAETAQMILLLYGGE